MHRKVFQVLAAIYFLTLNLPRVFAQEGGYVSQLSVAKGDSIAFFLSSANTTLDLNIYRLGEKRTLVTTIPRVTGGIQVTPDSSYFYGCKWKKNAGIIIPNEWSSGVYEADLPTSSGIKPIIFVVREKILASTSKILVNLTTNTWQAYNNYGGKSLYHFNSTNTDECPRLSLNRPFSDTTAKFYFFWTDKLVRWLAKENIPVEFCVSSDLDRDPEFMHHYQMYITVGHDEYWSLPERDECEHLIERGGTMLVLSGNTCWWQARIEDSGRTFVCYRDAGLDPEAGKDSIITSVWSRPPLNDPENKFLGTSFQNGGYVNSGTLFPATDGYGGYTVFNSQNWIYKNTGVKDGDVIGFDDHIVGYETDGVLYNWQEGIPTVTSIDSCPKSFRILGMSPAANSSGTRNGDATMGYYYTPSGGAVFNTASVNWVAGLDTNRIIQQMLRNIIQQFNRGTLPPEIIRAEPVTVKPENIDHEDVFIGSRIFPLDYNSIDSFVVHAVDPIGRKLFYSWQCEGKPLGSDSMLYLLPQVKKQFPKGMVITVFVSNDTGTVQMDWILVGQESVAASDNSNHVICYPNPFSDNTHLQFTLEEHALVEIEITSVMGEHIRTLLPSAQLSSGSHSISWDRINDNDHKIPVGIYYCTVKIRSSGGRIYSAVEKLVVY